MIDQDIKDMAEDARDAFDAVNNPTRIKLSLKLGILGGIIWGMFFTAYYSMLPNFDFAWKAASVCFVSIIIIFLILPSIIGAIKEAMQK